MLCFFKHRGEQQHGPAAVAMGLIGKSKEKKATEAATIEGRADAHEDGPIDNPYIQENK